MSTNGTLHIGEVAERVDLSLRSVRYYEEQGLVKPEGRTSGGFRLYTEAQIDRLLLIKQMKPLGFSIEEMRELLDARDVVAAGDSAAAARAAAQERLAGFAAYTAERCDKLRRHLAAGEQLAATLQAEAAELA